MNKPKYLYRGETLFRIYEFVSEGPKGRIEKMIQFVETGTENVYNLVLEIMMLKQSLLMT